MSAGHPSLGLKVSELPTPSLLLDLDVFDSNCAAISSHLEGNGAAWRPHVKGHKSPRLAQRMVAAGAIGITCAKVGEAEVMVAGGITEMPGLDWPGCRARLGSALPSTMLSTSALQPPQEPSAVSGSRC